MAGFCLLRLTTNYLYLYRRPMAKPKAKPQPTPSPTPKYQSYTYSLHVEVAAKLAALARQHGSVNKALRVVLKVKG